MKSAIIIISDPKAGEEATARVFNALALAVESKQAGDEVAISFIGTGTRWPAELSQLTSPLHALYNAVRDLIVGASRGCADTFGASDGLKVCGVPTESNNAVPGTSGLLSIRRYQQEGWHVLLF